MDDPEKQNTEKKLPDTEVKDTGMETVETKTMPKEVLDEKKKEQEAAQKIETHTERKITTFQKTLNFSKKLSIKLGGLLRKLYVFVKKIGRNVKFVCLLNSLVAMFVAGFTAALNLWGWMFFMSYLSIIHLRSFGNKELVFGMNVIVCSCLLGITGYNGNYSWSVLMFFFILTHVSNLLHVPNSVIARKTEDFIEQLSQPG